MKKVNVVRLKREIKDAGYNGATITDKAGLKNYDLYNIYKGKSSSIPNLERICEILGKPIEYFFEDSEIYTSPLNKVEYATETTDISFDTSLYRKSLNEVTNSFQKHGASLNQDFIIELANTVYKDASECGGEINSILVDGLVRMAINGNKLDSTR